MKKVILINNRKFLLTSALLMSNSVNLLGFFLVKDAWANHVSSVSVTHKEFNHLLDIETRATQVVIGLKENPDHLEFSIDVLNFIKDNVEWLEKETEIPVGRISGYLKSGKIKML